MSPDFPEGHVFYRNLHYQYPLISRGQKAYLYDTKGKKYLDASGGAAVVNIGHAVKEISQAISAQAQKLAYVSGMQFTHQPVERLADQISTFLPFTDGKIYFLSSGSEAVEASIKLARQLWAEKNQSTKSRFICRSPGYHGNTLAALSLSSRRHYKDIFRPMLTENISIPAPYCYRCFWREKYPDCRLKCAYELEKKIIEQGKENVAALVTEVIGGASTGASVPPGEYWQVVRKICDEYEVLLIVDEIMTGIGRTGKWLACHHFGLVPDVIIMGKGLTGGYMPLSALAVKKDIVDSIGRKEKSFLHAQTYSHHPVSCAAGLATLDYIKKNNLVEQSLEKGKVLMSELLTLLDYPYVGDIRGKGMLLGMEFVQDKEEKIPFPRKKKFVEQFLSKAMDKGAILWPHIGHANGYDGDLVLIAPPFVITPKEITTLKSVLKEILTEMKNMESRNEG
ncbi:MAG: aspartate aminotransferase family protein [Candidatus Aminicenantes bacterium]